jgi:hypothetical protein
MDGKQPLFEKSGAKIFLTLGMGAAYDNAPAAVLGDFVHNSEDGRI